MKLKAYGIRKCLLDCIQNFLTDRKQRGTYVYSMVAILFAPQFLVDSPRVSPWTPVLFISAIYVNDIPSFVDILVLLFADDAKVYQSIRCEMDYLQLQCDIAILYNWSKTWLLNFNISKRYLLHLYPTHCYGKNYINNSEITPTKSVKDWESLLILFLCSIYTQVQ